MIKLTISNQKGGVGKSTIAFHLAHYLKEQGARVAFIDNDGQGNASAILSDFGHGDISAYDLFSKTLDQPFDEQPLLLVKGTNDLAQLDVSPSGKMVSTFVNNLDKLFGQYDYCIIDTAPALNYRLMASLVASTHVLAPIELANFSIDGVKKLLNIIHGVKRQHNKGLTFLGMLPNRVNSASSSHRAAIKDLLATYPEDVLKAYLVNRAPIADAIDHGIPVWRVKPMSGNTQKAAKEMRHALGTIDKKLQETP